MPRYLNLDHFVKADHYQERLFTSTHVPSEKVLVSGIYVCENCGRETHARANDTLPPETDCGSHKRPGVRSGDVKWRLAAATIDGGLDHVPGQDYGASG